MSEMEVTGHRSVEQQIAYVLAIFVSILQIMMNMTSLVSGFWPNAIHFAGYVVLCAFFYPAFKKYEDKDWLHYLSIAFAFLTVFCTWWIFTNEDAIYDRGVHLAPMDWFASLVIIVAVLEFIRRTTGWLIPVILIIALGYVSWWGQYLSGVFRFAGLSFETVVFRSIFGDDGMFGTIATISSTFVVMFIIFGAFLVRSGAGDFIILMAQALASRFKGGPGLVAVIASGLTGTISGSAVANTASTGVITIPLMKKTGFPPKFAAGVEAAASTGGQLMPPIMGAGAFVMANYTQIPYTQIVLVSFLPALLYFFSIGVMVRIQADKSGIGTHKEAGEPIGKILLHSGPSFIIPIVLLITLLIMGYSPTYSAGFAILAIILASWLTPNRMGIKAICDALAMGSRNMVLTAILLIGIGLVVNVVSTTGIGNTFSLMIVNWSQGYLWLAILLIALASLVLGMGLPVTAAYIMIATISAPALQQLILENQFITGLMTNGANEATRITLMLLMPELTDLLSQASMTRIEAESILAAVPIDLKSTVLEQSLSATFITTALLSAHMIIFWLSQDSNVTPPVCLTAFTAAAIAKTPPMATGVSAWKLAKALYIVPLLFAYTPLLAGNWNEAIVITIFAALGFFCASALLLNWMGKPLDIVSRVLLIIACLLFFWPLTWLQHSIGIVFWLAAVFWQRWQINSSGNSASSPG